MGQFTAEQWEKILQKTAANYKYTQLNNSFIRSVFGKTNNCLSIDTQYVESMGKNVVSPTKDFKAFLLYGNRYYIIESDFEIITLEGFVEPELTKRWREGMVKNALPLYDSENKIDVKHYLQDLREYEQEKLAHSMEHLGTIAAERREIEYMAIAKRKIELGDLQAFFKTLGLDWTGRYYDAKNIHAEPTGKTAQSFEEIEKYSNGPIDFLFWRNKDTFYKMFYVTRNRFQEYTSESEIYGGSNLYAGKDYTNQWMKFQTEKIDHKAPSADKGRN